MRRLVVVLALALLALVRPSPAWAHASLLSMDPASGSAVEVRPDAVRLRFSEPVDRPASVVVTGPTGQRVSLGEAGVLGDRVSERLRAVDTGAGEYAVSYQVLSVDGHVVTGTAHFTVAGDGAAGTVDTGPSPARPSVLLTASALVLLLVLASAGVSRLARDARA
jgi:methionine-rich copper-binding protein CopC